MILFLCYVLLCWLISFWFILNEPGNLVEARRTFYLVMFVFSPIFVPAITIVAITCFVIEFIDECL